MERAEKREVVSALSDVFANTGVVVVAHYAGLSVSEMTKLRSEMGEAGGRVKVAKNRLVKLALDGTDVQGISDLMAGPTCLAYSEDPVAAPKVAVKFAKGNENFVILGGAMGPTIHRRVRLPARLVHRPLSSRGSSAHMARRTQRRPLTIYIETKELNVRG